ncbi:hypothetical protein QJS10_CPB19g00807 [Acorus calamus]|uniref:Uncharacterized protein n=1 Tax=Acorus calamus TaxID=4465 RepID=A0AAV9CHK9_ACOCL|nr:hypothetical protein QJS10_CPB19g00807 [Acorus calamus]
MEAQKPRKGTAKRGYHKESKGSSKKVVGFVVVVSSIASWWRMESNSSGWWEDEEVGGEGSEVELEEVARLGLHGWMISRALWMSWGMETSGNDEIMRSLRRLGLKKMKGRRMFYKRKRGWLLMLPSHPTMTRSSNLITCQDMINSMWPQLHSSCLA